MSIILENLTKRYGNQFVVDNVSLEISDRELFVLLGASGSGKSTILRLIAGLSAPTGGRIMLHGRDVTDLTPQERGTGFVFQNYSIFRHMSVGENIEFGLKIRRVSREERQRKREQLLDLVGLAGLGGRYADQLSGGQQQRVALARALAYEPNVLLLDEPFGALDVKIRAQLRRSLKEIQRRLGVTTILVTHDQEEAFELADRIGVLERGRLLEVGDGEGLYSRPRTLFAATFLGASTVLVGRAEGGQARFGHLLLPVPPEPRHEEGAPVLLLFRPEQVQLAAAESPPGNNLPVIGKGKVVEENFTGPMRRLRLRLPRLAGTRQMSPPLPFGEEGLLVDAVVPSDATPDGKELWVGLSDWTVLEPSAPRLLVCDYGEDSAAALALARPLAEKLQASVTVLAVADSPESGDKVRALYKESLPREGLGHAEFHLRYGDPVEQLGIEQAESYYEMLIIAPSARSRGLRRREPRSLGEALSSLMLGADIPVLVVKNRGGAITRLLICTAAGEPGKSDVRMGGRLARQVGAAVTLFYVTRDSSPPGPLARAHLERAAATLRALDVACEVKTRQAAKPSEGILAELASDDYNLVVLGSHGPRVQSLFGIDDVTTQVIQEANIPVLVVPAEEF